MKTRHRYKVLTHCALGSLGPLEAGEIVNTDQLAKVTLDEQVTAGTLCHVDHQKWEDTAGPDGKGDWVTTEQPKAEETAKPEEPAGAGSAGPGGDGKEKDGAAKK